MLYCVKLVVKDDCNWIHYVLTPIKQLILEGAVSGNKALWFLPSLLAVQVIYSNLSKRMNDFCIMVFALVIAYVLFLMDIHHPLYIGNISLGILAYSFGHLMKKIQYNFNIYTVAIIIYVMILLLIPSKIDVYLNNCDRGYYLLAIAFSLSGCIVVNNIFKLIPFQFSFLELIGKRSMIFYVMHWFPIYLCSIIFPFSGWVMFGLLVLVSVVVLYSIDRVYAKICIN